MKLKEARIFISYARKDVAEVNELYDKLKRYGFSPWIDNKDILPGQKWWDAIRKAIREAPFFLACLSNYSVNRRGVIRREVNEALDILREKLSDDIYLIPVRLEECPAPEELSSYQWVNLFEPGGFEQLSKALRHGLKQLGIDTPLNLRSQPLENLSPADAAAMIKERNFYAYNYWHGTGIHHEYDPQTINGDKVIIDHTTGLMWQQGGSQKRMNYKAGGEYIAELNTKKIAGFDGWRLPTLEEAMSLMEPKRRGKDGLYINPLFDAKYDWIWTADHYSALHVWVVDFGYGSCSNCRVDVSIDYVRAVRSR